VTLSEEYASLVPPLSAADKEWLEFEVADAGAVVGDGSRLASKIVLSPEMNGMVVGVMHTHSQNRN
jgi:hypothetical protein